MLDSNIYTFSIHGMTWLSFVTFSIVIKLYFHSIFVFSVINFAMYKTPFCQVCYHYYIHYVKRLTCRKRIHMSVTGNGHIPFFLEYTSYILSLA